MELKQKKYENMGAKKVGRNMDWKWVKLRLK
jgi:hypothetical protein